MFHLNAWTESQDSVLEPQFLKRKESRSGSNRGPAYQPSAFPLGQTGSQSGREEWGRGEVLMYSDELGMVW